MWTSTPQWASMDTPSVVWRVCGVSHRQWDATHITMLKWTSISGSTDPSSLAHTNLPTRPAALNSIILEQLDFSRQLHSASGPAAHEPAQPRQEDKVAGAKMRWWECDEVNLIAANLSGSSLAAFACCKAIRANLRSRDTLRCVRSEEDRRTMRLQQRVKREMVRLNNGARPDGWQS